MHFSLYATEMGARNGRLCLLFKNVGGLETVCPEVHLAAKQRNDSLSKESGCATLSCILEGMVLNEIWGG